MKIKNLRYKLPIWGPKTIYLAMEFGIILSETAKKKKIKLTPEIVERAELIFVKELKLKGYKKTALNFTPLILAVLEK